MSRAGLFSWTGLLHLHAEGRTTVMRSAVSAVKGAALSPPYEGRSFQRPNVFETKMWAFRKVETVETAVKNFIFFLFRDSGVKKIVKKVKYSTASALVTL